MAFFSKISLQDLSQIIIETDTQLFLCLPSIPNIISDAIIQLKEKRAEVKINLLIDFDPQTFRQGYGEFDAFTKLEEQGLNITNFKDNRVSFVISDNIGYYLFIESQYLVPAEKETLNAIRIDSVSMVKLKQHFFGASMVENYTNELSNAIIEESKELRELQNTPVLPSPAITNTITQKESEDVKANIDKNPPLSPDYKRIMNVYSNKFQYVDVVFSKVNIRNIIVDVPKDLLPIKNDRLRKQFQTKISAIDKDAEIKGLDELTDLKKKLTDKRKKHLKHLRHCNRSVLKISEKNDFNTEINKLQKEIPKLIKKIRAELQAELKKTKGSFKDEVFELYIKEPKLIFGENSIWNDPESVRDAAEYKSETVISEMNWPDYFKLLSQMSIKTFYSDITIDDLHNQELLDEFKEKKLISEADISKLSNLNKAYTVKQNNA